MQMGKIVWHIFYKEWIKTRWTYLAALVLGLATVFYVFIRVENGMERFGAKTYMLKVLYDNPPLIYYRMLLYVPLLIAASVGVTQYLPETVNRRIRLMLHLPVASTRLVLGMALYGVAAVTVSNALLYGLTWLSLRLLGSAGIVEELAKLITLPFTTILNFLGNKLVIFRDAGKQASGRE